MRYTVKQLADLAGVTVRTLHHYDEIGLPKPSSVGDNGYRYYGEAALYHLQQILFYRELDVPLDEIKRIVGRPDFDVLAALESHRTALRAEAQRVEKLIRTIDLTTRHLKGKVSMSDQQLFRGFSDEQQAEMAAEAEQQWGESARASNARWKKYPAEKKQRIMDEGNALYKEMIGAMPEVILTGHHFGRCRYQEARTAIEYQDGID